MFSRVALSILGVHSPIGQVSYTFPSHIACIKGGGGPDRIEIAYVLNGRPLVVVLGVLNEICKPQRMKNHFVLYFFLVMGLPIINQKYDKTYAPIIS